MKMRWRAMAAAWTTAMLGVGAAQAGFYEGLYRGLEVFATPIGAQLSTLADGSRVNGSRLGRLRVVPNQLGDGYRLELDRTFGPDSQGRPEIFDAGAFELELVGDTQATLSYTDRFGLLTGNADFTATNLQYRTAVKTGAIDATLTGTLNVSNALEINELGFYTMTVNVANTDAELIFDSLPEYVDEEIDFAVGPITVRGNVYLDLFIGLLDALGLDTSGLQAFSSQSAIDQVGGAFEEALNDAGLAADKGLDMQARMSSLLAFPDDEQVVADLVAPAAAEKLAPDAPAETPQAEDVVLTPEPSALLLLLLGATALRGRSR